MDKLRPHVYLERIPNTNDFTLSVIIHVPSDLELDPTKPFPIEPKYGQTIKGGRYEGLKETVIEIPFRDRMPPKDEKSAPTPTPIVCMGFQLKDAEIVKGDDKRVRVVAKHIHSDHNHDGTSSAHYGDPGEG